MKNRGKGKKKQWQRLMKGAESELDEARKQNQIIATDFSLKAIESRPKPIRGNKNSAKDVVDSEIVRDVGAIPRLRPRRKNRREKFQDAWTDECVVPASSKRLAKRIPRQIDLPIKGQSYKPTSEEYQALTSFLQLEEEEKIAETNRINRFFAPTRNAETGTDSLSLAQSYFNDRSAGKPLGIEKLDEDHPQDYPLLSSKKQKHKSTQQLMKEELANIHFIVKDLKREKKALMQKQEKRKLRKALKQTLTQPTQHIAFQTPEEMASCVRRLLPEGDLLKEVELRNKKIPSKSNKLNIVKSKKLFNRPHRK